MIRGRCKCGGERRPVAWVRRDLAHLVEGARGALAKSEAAMKLHGEERKDKVFEALGAHSWQAEHTAIELPALVEELGGRCRSCARERAAKVEAPANRCEGCGDEIKQGAAWCMTASVAR